MLQSTNEQKKSLLNLKRNKLLSAHKLHKNERFIDRIKAILLLNKGWSFSLIAEALLIKERTVRNYKKSYDEGDLDHLLKVNY